MKKYIYLVMLCLFVSSVSAMYANNNVVHACIADGIFYNEVDINMENCTFTFPYFVYLVSRNTGNPNLACSNSMKEIWCENTTLIVRPIFPETDIMLGMTYFYNIDHSAWQKGEDLRWAIHEAISYDNSTNKYIFKGNNNENEDPIPVERKLIAYEVVGILHGAR